MKKGCTRNLEDKVMVEIGKNKTHRYICICQIKYLISSWNITQKHKRILRHKPSSLFVFRTVESFTRSR